MSESTTIRWDQDEDGIVVLTLDEPGEKVNTMNAAYRASMEATVERLEAERERIAGVVVASGKSSFFAGGNLNELIAVTTDELEDFAAVMDTLRAQLRRLETLGKPVVAAINGVALGGGLEICLACHHRIVVDDPKAQLGCPEVTFGLLPGAGGVTRSVRLLGVLPALQHVLLRGQRHQPAAAKQLGLVDEVVATREELIPAAKAWIKANPEARQPWDAPGYAMPGGRPDDAALAGHVLALPSTLRKQLKGANYPAPHHIMSAAVEGAQVDFDTAIAIESRYFLDLITGQVAKSMIQGHFFDMQQAGGDRGRSGGEEPFRAQKVVVLGAGMMGAAIAYTCAKAGIEVVLKDVSQEAADRGKGYSARLVAQAVERGKATQADGDALLARIVPTDDAAAAAGADLVIEAVFEDPTVKAQVFAEIEPQLAPDALLGSNTSTLPITELAEHVTRPEDFIGLHFFSPVDKMPLLEIIKGERTSEAAVARALDLAKQIKKTPIVVNDARGFFTSRVIFTFLNEGMAMLAEGVPAPSIEQASSQAGYPAPVLQLCDELNLALLRRVCVAARAAGVTGTSWAAGPGEPVIDRMLDELERPGRLGGAGFYAYEDGKRVGLWEGLTEAFPPVDDPSAVPLRDLVERLLFVEAIESIRCLEEGVIESAADANVGSLLGIGYPGWTGGVLQYVNGYADAARNPDGGLPAFVTRARELAARYGARFEPPALLVEMAERGETFGDAPALAEAAGR